MKKKWMYGLVVSTLMLTGCFTAGNNFTANAADSKEIKEVQVTCAPTSDDVDYGMNKYDVPDEKEISANKKLREVIGQWEEKGEFPDYFTWSGFFGTDSLYPVIQLTDISEETKRDFFELTGVEHEKWIFVESLYSRKELLEIEKQIEEEYGDKEYIEDIYVVGVTRITDIGGEMLPNGQLWDARPSENIVAPLTVNVIVEPLLTDEQIEEIQREMQDEYGKGTVSVFICETLVHDKNDFSGNGVIDLEDARLALCYALKIYNNIDYEKITLADAQYILKLALKIEEGI